MFSRIVYITTRKIKKLRYFPIPGLEQIITQEIITLFKNQPPMHVKL